MCICYKFSNSTETPHEIEIPLTIPALEEFTHKPVTLGDHLRRRRIKLGLFQKDVAARLGVTTPTVWNWENRGSVDLLGKLAWYKQVNGLTLEQLGVKTGRDPEQLADWLSGRHKPCRRNREGIEGFLASHNQDLFGIQPFETV